MSSNTPRALLFLDYEGTLGTSVERHFVQYVEALARLKSWLAGRLDEAATRFLEPLPKDEFLTQYARVKRIGRLLQVANTNMPEAIVLQAILDQMHAEIIWEYRPEHMQHERVIAGAQQNLARLAGSFRCIVVSYTRQDRGDFAEHLIRLELAGPGVIEIDDVVTVGAEGQKSREAKAAAIQSRFGEEIRSQLASGRRPVLVADATDDMAAAFDCGLAFLGVCDTGKSTRSDFAGALREERTERASELHAVFTDSAGNPELPELLAVLSGG